MAKAVESVTIDMTPLRDGLADMARALELDVADDATPETLTRMICDEVIAVRERADANEADAQIGRDYRDQLIADALAQGVRAKGDEFAQDIYKGVLQNSTVEGIKRMRDDWQKDGDARLGGGRQSGNGEEPINLDEHREPVRGRNVPDKAFVRG